MKNLLIIISLTTVLISCKTTKNVDQKQDVVIFTLDKKSGRGPAPVYSLKLYESGKALFTGTKNTSKIGTYKKNLNKETIEALKKAFIKADFFDFKDEYTSRITDLPTTYISFKQKNLYKRIRDYYGAPENLKTLEKLLEDIAESDNWQKYEIKRD